MKHLLKNIRENYSKEEKQEEDKVITLMNWINKYKTLIFKDFY